MFRMSALLVLLGGMPGALAAPALPAPAGKKAIDAAWAVAGPADAGAGAPPRVAVDDKGTVTLRDRGMLVSRHPYGPVTVSFRWKWAEVEWKAGESADHLGVGLRLAGPPGEKTNYHIDDGLLVTLVPNAGGKVVINVVRPQAGGLMIQELDDKPVPLKRGAEYAVKVVDEGEVVRVVVDGKEVASARVPAGGQGLVAVHSQPPFGGPVAAVVRELRAERKK
jgi:hypothetical protein